MVQGDTPEEIYEKVRTCIPVAMIQSGFLHGDINAGKSSSFKVKDVIQEQSGDTIWVPSKEKL